MSYGKTEQCEQGDHELCDGIDFNTQTGCLCRCHDEKEPE